MFQSQMFNVKNMSLNVIRENKIIAEISKLTVFNCALSRYLIAATNYLFLKWKVFRQILT